MTFGYIVNQTVTDGIKSSVNAFCIKTMTKLRRMAFFKRC